MPPREARLSEAETNTEENRTEKYRKKFLRTLFKELDLAMSEVHP